MSIIKTHDITLFSVTDKHSITLRPLSDEHLPLLYKWNSDPEVLYWSDGDIVEKHDEKTVQHIYGQTSQASFCFLVEADGVTIGDYWLQRMNLKNVLAMHSQEEDVRRIDMVIGEKAYWNSGIGTEMIRMLADFAFTWETADYLYGLTFDYNIRSTRAFEKNGFQLFLREPSAQAPNKAKEDIYMRLSKEEYIENRRARVPIDKAFELPLADLQPSQLYISEGKLRLARNWFNPGDKSCFDPIPIKQYMGKYMMTDGHTRATLATLSAWETVPVTWDEDPLDMQAYGECVRWCDEAGIKNATDLAKRIIAVKDYALLWDKRCDILHQELADAND